MLQKKPEYNINSVTPLYLLIGEIDGFIEEENGSKYLDIAVTDNNNEVLENTQKYGAELKIKSRR